MAQELPRWLLEKITADEKEIAANPKSGLNIGAWIRYEYNGSLYFEYDNMISSSFPPVYHYSGTIMNDPVTFQYQEYQQGKCCILIVWKGRYYTDL